MIYLIRHGQTITNASGLLVGRSDPPLTELGERQALSLRDWLSGVREVWTSPLERARRTAELACGGLVAEVREEFIEVDYGKWEGRKLSEVNLAQWEEFEGGADVAFDGGESLRSVDRRVHSALDRLLMDPSSLLHRDDEHLAIFSHVSPIKSALTWALGVDGSVAWRTRLDNGSLTVLATRGSSARLIRFNAVPDLRREL